jgi:hypothetical protein
MRRARALSAAIAAVDEGPDGSGSGSKIGPGPIPMQSCMAVSKAESLLNAGVVAPDASATRSVAGSAENASSSWRSVSRRSRSVGQLHLIVFMAPTRPTEGGKRRAGGSAPFSYQNNGPLSFETQAQRVGKKV